MKYRLVLSLLLILVIPFRLKSAAQDEQQMKKTFDALQSCFVENWSDQCLKQAEDFRTKFAGNKNVGTYYVDIITMVYKRAGVDACLQFALPVLNDIQDDESYVRTTEKIGFCYALKNRFDSSAYYLALSKTRAQEAGLEKLELDVMNRIAGNWRAKGDYERAQKIYLEVVERSEKIEYHFARATALNGLGRLFGMMELEQKSVRYFEQAAEAYYQSNDTTSALVASINQANSLISLGELKKAKKLLLRANEILDSRPDVYIHIGCLGQLARVQELNEELDEAISTYQKVIALAKGAGISSQQAYYLNKIAQAYTRQDKLDLAEENARAALATYGSSGSNDEMHEVYLTLYKLYEKRGLFEEAYRYRLKFDELSDSIMNKRQKEEVLAMEEKYRDNLAKKELEIAVQKNINRRNILVAIVTLFVVILALGIVWVNRQRLRNKAEKALAIEREKNLELELNQKKRELVGKALIISEKNELLDHLQNRLNNASNHVDEHVNELLKEIQIATVSGKDWKSFLDTFEQLHPSYLKKLQEDHPDLSENELRFCALICLKFNNKEIAAIQHITDEGVKKARYRLKKKLALDKDDSLTEYLKEVRV